MRAAVLYERNQPMLVQDVDLAAPKPGEVLVRLSAAGICHSDLHAITGDLGTQLPVVLGHEGAGYVEAVGPGVTEFATGDKVVLCWAPSCGHCHYCSHGRPNLCDDLNKVYASGGLRDGTSRLSRQGKPVYHFIGTACFAEYVVVPSSGAIKVPADTDLHAAAVVGCAVVTGIGAVLNTAKLQPGSTAVVFGTGGIGLNVIQGARLAGASRIIAVDMLDSKLEKALQFGATDCINAGQDNVVKAIRGLTGGRGADYAFEAVGNAGVAANAFAAAAKGGTVVCIGLAPIGTQYSFDAYWLLSGEKTVKGCWYGSANPQLDVPKLLELHRLGRIQLDGLFSQRYSLDEINLGVEDLRAGKVIRPLVVFD